MNHLNFLVNPQLLAEIQKYHQQADPAHNWHHLIRVVDHLQKALQEESLDFQQRQMVILAGYLHEIDDSKLKIPVSSRELLERYLPPIPSRQHIIQTVETMISLVSTRANHQEIIDDYQSWLYLVRDADRLEAIGEVGIARCYAYSIEQGSPLFTPSTPRPLSESQVIKLISPGRFQQYQGKSASFLDHFYDKLLHLTVVASGNQYLRQEHAKRYQEMLDFLVSFGRRGKLDLIWLEDLKFKYCR